MAKLQGQIAVVTGASAGLGKGIALALAREGARVMLTSRVREKLDAAAEEVHAAVGEADVATCLCDVSDEEQVARLFRTVERQYERLDLLVNNAGCFDGGPLDELSLDAWDRVLATNLCGPFLCTRGALRIMKRQGRGRIINIGSIASQRVRPGSGPYAASKHGLWGLTQVTALEGREYGVTCGMLNPGNIGVPRRTGTSLAEDAEPMMTVDDVAQVALLMAALPPGVELLEATVLPHQQRFVGRG